jgi:hypothetical protein
MHSPVWQAVEVKFQEASELVGEGVGSINMQMAMGPAGGGVVLLSLPLVCPLECPNCHSLPTPSSLCFLTPHARDCPYCSQLESQRAESTTSQ